MTPFAWTMFGLAGGLFLAAGIILARSRRHDV
jgi:LPXTG-motif cell wall-anchored protein